MPFLVFLRQFIANTYPVLKQHNPDLPILIRQAKGTPARVFARFGAFNHSADASPSQSKYIGHRVL